MYMYKPMREYRSFGKAQTEAREPLPMHDPEFYSVYFQGEDELASWTADFASESDANDYCYYRNKEPEGATQGGQ